MVFVLNVIRQMMHLCELLRIRIYLLSDPINTAHKETEATVIIFLRTSSLPFYAFGVQKNCPECNSVTSYVSGSRSVDSLMIFTDCCTHLRQLIL